MSANINLGNIGVHLDLTGGDHLGGAIANALTTGVRANAGVTLAGGVDIGLDNIKADVGLDNIKADLGLDGIKADVGLDKIKADIGLDSIRIREIAPIRTDSKVDLGLSIRELPTIRFELSMRPIRVHLPLNYNFCLELFGVRLFKFSVCGEGMAVTEDNQPHETERCQ